MRPVRRAMEPLISIQLHGGPRYHPGEVLVCDYQIDAVECAELQAVEASVLWYTEGKGEEDMGVHYFERRTPADVPGGDLRSLRRLETVLPSSPLSYHGPLVTIRWCVRVRVFLRPGRSVCFEKPFVLGSVTGGSIG